MTDARKDTVCTLAPDLQFGTEGSVATARFDDIYFHPGSGADEARHVFIGGNQLEARWQKLSRSGESAFTIVETGFGTGLNFLATWDLWRQTAGKLSSQPANTLYYYSVERFPLTHLALASCVHHYNPFAELSRQLLDSYPDYIADSYLLEFDGGRVKLVLLFADAVDALDGLEHYPSGLTAKGKVDSANLAVDAWFLDGFAPSKNPQMWSPELFQRMARHSHGQTTAATFTVARRVRDGLANAGFSCEKQAGYGRKREMLCARYTAARHTVEPEPQRGYTLSPCYRRSSEPVTREDRNALVIGAGIAGSCIAHKLAHCGWQVTVVDQAAGFADAASGNERAVLYARTNDTRSALGRFHEAGFHYAVNFYRQLGLNEDELGLHGMLQLLETGDSSLSHLPGGTELNSRQTVSIEQASELAAVSLTSGGIYYPDSGWLSPHAVCSRLLDHHNIRFLPGTMVHSLQRTDNSWQVNTTGNDVSDHAVVVVASGQESARFEQTSWLPLKSIRGQTTAVNSTAALENLQCVICQRGYLTPAYTVNGSAARHCLGATFNLDEHSSAAREQDHRENIDNMLQALEANPELQAHFKTLDYASLDARVSFRCVTPDYLPVAGPVVDSAAFRQQYAALSKNAKHTPASSAPLLPGLFVNTGYGSRGFSSAPLAAAVLAAQITGDPIPLNDELRKSIAPARFLLRQLIKGK